MADDLIKVSELKKYFLQKDGLLFGGKGVVKAVDDVSFNIEEGQTLGIVGESGCGKSTLGRLLLRLLEPTSGEVYFQGKNIFHLDKKELLKARRNFQMIFQDPYASMNPRMTVRAILEEPLTTHGTAKAEWKKIIQHLLDVVGIAQNSLERYPHEFSGGQRQRIGIARALALRPKFIVADEPVAALDVSIQAQILNLLVDLQKEFKLTYLFIAHDLSVVQYISQRVGVMYLGQMVEINSRDELYKNPLHPYTKALLSAIPVPDPFFEKRRIHLVGELPSPLNPPPGCPFHTRCPSADEECRQVKPILREIQEGHFVSCNKVEGDVK